MVHFGYLNAFFDIDFCRMIQAPSLTVGRIGSSNIVTQQLRDRAIQPPGAAGNEKRVVGMKIFGTLGQRKRSIQTTIDKTICRGYNTIYNW